MNDCFERFEAIWSARKLTAKFLTVDDAVPNGARELSFDQLRCLAGIKLVNHSIGIIRREYRLRQRALPQLISPSLWNP